MPTAKQGACKLLARGKAALGRTRPAGPQCKDPSHAPAPLACTTRSGMRSRSKWASLSISATSESTMGPRGPAVMLSRLLSTGAPQPVVSVSRFRIACKAHPHARTHARTKRKAHACDGRTHPSSTPFRGVLIHIWCSGPNACSASEGPALLSFLLPPPPPSNSVALSCQHNIAWAGASWARLDRPNRPHVLRVLPFPAFNRHNRTPSRP